MMRRDLFKLAGGLSLMAAEAGARSGGGTFRRVRPGEPGWPSPTQWRELDAEVGGQLLAVHSPLDACRNGADPAACKALFKGFKNPYFIRDNVALTQTTGWADAWVSQPSAYAVAARNAADVAAAVDFAREHRLRLVVRGGGHSYLGNSNAPDSLLIWTRPMDSLVMHDAFVPQGCDTPPQPAASVGAGNVWLKAYAAVTKTGRYVQGGGCCTVGVAGLIQGGGFGSFSKRFGLAGASLLEAEVVTADGQIRIANACTHPDLFWALKGGGGGFGVVTRVTLKTHELPSFLGGAFGAIKANSDQAFRRLIARFVAFYRERLFNPHWGETVRFNGDNRFEISMVFQGLDQGTAAAIWKPFLDWIAASPSDYSIATPFMALAAPAHFFWDVAFLKQNLPQIIISDSRPGASDDAVFWASNLGEAGWFLHDYESVWLPQALLANDAQSLLVDALFDASRHWPLQLHFNKGLAGAPPEALAAARDTPMNPDVVDAFALVIAAASGPPAFAGVPGHEPDLARARREAAAVAATLAEIRKVAPNAGTYVAESSYFQKDWQAAYWGDNYARLQAVKRNYDPDGLFFVHHGVGSEDWSADGFTRLT